MGSGDGAVHEVSRRRRMPVLPVVLQVQDEHTGDGELEAAIGSLRRSRYSKAVAVRSRIWKHMARY